MSQVRNGVSIVVGLLPLLLFAFAPLVSSASGRVVAWRPPPVTYSIVWSALIVCIIVSWWFVCAATTCDHTSWVALGGLYTTLVALSVAWIVLYNRDKSHGIPVFLSLLMVLSATLPATHHVDPRASSLLAPLLVWGVFQLAVNCAEVAALQDAECLDTSERVLFVHGATGRH
jgi:tryptophan-rich sensory protein